MAPLPAWTHQVTQQLLSTQPGNRGLDSTVSSTGESSTAQSSNRTSSRITTSSLEKQKAPLLLPHPRSKPYEPVLSTIEPSPKSTPSPPLDLSQLWSDLARLSERASPPSSDSSQPGRGKSKDPEWALDRPLTAGMGVWLFWFGFLCPVLWWVGALFPRHPDRISKIAHRWQVINRLMSLFFSLLLILFIIAFSVCSWIEVQQIGEAASAGDYESSTLPLSVDEAHDMQAAGLAIHKTRQ
ncbi:hypothetical protein DM01DRAFT_1369611 [Hesseltinella vesiculosa]|uniref:Uncharacterized protein n=1 Tax=Hesseltinella vesiculosa TaxID=101127 RepID=A0A1X2GY98_9FUNG|nr:hypothetical protein DM01DRAFT_1369611 [Hesseltinella vesiculosa]